MKVLTREEVLEKAKEYNVKFIRLQFTDIFGSFKNIAITVEELERALAGQVMFDSAVVEGFIRNQESEIYLYPDPATFEIFPWRPRDGAVARLICDICSAEGETFPGCSRSALKRVLKKTAGTGLQLRAGAEIEFFLFHANEQGKATTITHDHAGYCDLSPVDLGENARRDMVLTLEEMGFEISSSHHEIAPGQHGIFIKEDSALAIADKIATFKFVVRTIAQRHGLHASFMPKPLAGEKGSGMRLHLSLWREGKNILEDSNDGLGLSETAYHYIGGVLGHARAITAIANPLINSYKRLLPDELSPCLVAWSEKNRSAMIRVPAQRGYGTRFILRSPDPACNSYLVLASVLAAGERGLAAKIEPPQPLPENHPGRGGLRELVRNNGLPRSFNEALHALAEDETVCAALGEHIARCYLEAKREEWERFMAEVHQWELDEYLANY
ncbi:glutamine synthetase family protein [Pelotomaculum terephthalicicum JT]|uniref:glutamine synthetase family protein n=1 Tax=Pelotomaculum terephthalicicum TaxID=206393 RepID=UPI0009CAD347|nr:glutamine synthetase family protein [Pelotomaculum terephthalicicum]MCG9966731.1 glutamine synthetase family protein [Pelotomaculum terephthalicicum JT]OPY61727.1 MAG: Glutamine synthetase [Pelotomaculum sp. PtaU1.Bin065]